MNLEPIYKTLPAQKLRISASNLDLYQDLFANRIINEIKFSQHFVKIFEYLHNLNRMPLQGDTRYHLTAPLINQYLLFISQVRVGQLQLNNSQEINLANLANEFTYATKLLLRDSSAQSTSQLTLLVYWVIATLCETIQDFSTQHQSQPENFWKDINLLYRYAESQHLADTQSNSPDHKDIASRLKHAIMFQATQPEHLNQREQTLIDAYLRKWSHHVEMTHQQNDTFYSHYFYLDLNSDAGVKMSRKISGYASDPNIRAINPLPLINQSRLHMSQLRKGTPAERIGFPNHTDNIEAFMVIKKALLAWKQASSRQCDRAPCSISARTGMGLDTIYQYLRSPREQSGELVESHTVNISAIGACVCIQDWANLEGLSVGDFVIHHQEDQSKGKLAVVRWIKRIEESIIFGIEFVVGNTQPVQVQVNNESSEALLISSSNNDSLITHIGYCENDIPVQLTSIRRKITFNARAESLIQRGQHADQIQLKRSQSA